MVEVIPVALLPLLVVADDEDVVVVVVVHAVVDDVVIVAEVPVGAGFANTTFFSFSLRTFSLLLLVLLTPVPPLFIFVLSGNKDSCFFFFCCWCVVRFSWLLLRYCLLSGAPIIFLVDGVDVEIVLSPEFSDFDRIGATVSVAVVIVVVVVLLLLTTDILEGPFSCFFMVRTFWPTFC